MPSKDKQSGILFHVSSIPSSDGIGTFGQGAFALLDFLKKSGQDIWQILPVCPIGLGNSPYSSPSAFAGNPYFIDFPFLERDGLLDKNDLFYFENNGRVDYDTVKEYKIPRLLKAADKLSSGSADFQKFCRENSTWLDDFSIFSTLCDVYGEPFTNWPDELKTRDSIELSIFRKQFNQDIYRHKAIQFLFFEQWNSLKNAAHNFGIKIFGDIPFYVSYKSADVWAHRDLFKIGRDLVPISVAGVPPDYFSRDGQLWGNPIYNWQQHRITNYRWWCSRIKHNLNLYDLLRIDHFRAFADYYAIPHGSMTAKEGVWHKGVGSEIFDRLPPETVKNRIIAEDLGQKSDMLKNLMAKTGVPGMKILQFAFLGPEYADFLPKNFGENCFCYTGTHDNDTVNGFFAAASSVVRTTFERIVPRGYADHAWRLISFGMKSRAKAVIIPIQDYLSLGSEAKMNTPSVANGNWEWRCPDDALTDELARKIKEISAR